MVNMFKLKKNILQAILMSCGVVKTPNFKLPYYKNEGCYRTENLQREIYLACLMTKESWKLRGLVILHFRILMTSGENQELFPRERCLLACTLIQCFRDPECHKSSNQQAENRPARLKQQLLRSARKRRVALPQSRLAYQKQSNCLDKMGQRVI